MIIMIDNVAYGNKDQLECEIWNEVGKTEYSSKYQPACSALQLNLDEQ